MPGWVEETDTTCFIKKRDILDDGHKDVTYERIMCHYREGKSKPKWTWLVVNKDKFNDREDCGTPMADILAIKLLHNSVV